MKKLVVLIVLVLGCGQLMAQEKITTNFSVKKVRIRLKENSNKLIKGALFSINDSTIVIANTLHKKDFRNGDYSLKEYRLADVKFIDGAKLNSNWSEHRWSRFKQNLGRRAIIKNEFEHLGLKKRRTRALAKRPTKYSSSIGINVSPSGIEVDGELPLYKWNTISLGAQFSRVSRPSKSFESRYVVKGYRKETPLEEMGQYEYGKYYFHAFFDNGTLYRSVAHAFGDFLPQSKINLNANIRTYFGVKPHVILKPFAEIGLLMKGVKGYKIDIETTANDKHDNYRGDWDYSEEVFLWVHYPHTEQGTEFIEKVTVGDAYTKWTPKLDFNMGLKVQRSKMFMEFKIGFPFQSDSWDLMEHDKYGYYYVGDRRPIYNVSMAFGYSF